MKPPRPITLDDEINEVAREIEMRERTYARLIEQNRMRPEMAERRKAIMLSVLHRLRGLKGDTSATPQEDE